jgi:hypothetical protein
MKVDQLKNLIKESVREAIQEELKDILLEAVRAPKASAPAVNTFESFNPHTPTQPQSKPAGIPSRLSGNPLQEMLAQTRASMNPAENRTLLEMGAPVGNVDLVNGRLPEGEVSMDTIMKLVKR